LASPVDPLEDCYPALYQAADAASLAAQRRFLLAFRIRLGGLLVATLGGGLILSLGEHDVGAWTAIVAFLSALGSELYTSIVRPERDWYEGRAAAESAKTLTWRYAVRGESYADLNDEDIDSRFSSEIRELLDDLVDLNFSQVETGGEQVTTGMRRVRATSFEERRSAYREGRIEIQREWYEQKALDNGRIANRWTIGVIVLELLGVVGGILTLTLDLEVDVLGLLAAGAATATGWLQAKQFKSLATAYWITAQELAAVKSDLDALSDDERWPYFVGQAEEAISREHTLWRASRGVWGKPARRAGS